jgi:hypothetical protein
VDAVDRKHCGNQADVLDQQFSATVASNQGSTAIDGAVRGIITRGGKAVIFLEMNGAGQFDTFKTDMETIYRSVAKTLPT